MPDTKPTPPLAPKPPRQRRNSRASDEEQKVPTKLAHRRMIGVAKAMGHEKGQASHLYSKGGGARKLARLQDDEIEGLVWDRLNGKPLKLYKWAKFDAVKELAFDIDSQTKEYKKTYYDDNKAKAMAAAAQAVGLAVPGLATIIASAKFAAGIKDYYGQMTALAQVENFRYQRLEAATFLNLGLSGMQGMLRKQSRFQACMVGTYAFDVAASVVPLGFLSHSAFAAIRTTAKVGAKIWTYHNVRALNGALEDRAAFNLKVFQRNAIMSCYLIDRLSPGELVGLYDAFYTDELEDDDRRLIEGTLRAGDRRWLDKFAKEVEPMKAIARAQIEANGYCDEEEERRRNGTHTWQAYKVDKKEQLKSMAQTIKDLPGDVKNLRANTRAYRAAQQELKARQMRKQRELWAKTQVEPLKARWGTQPQSKLQGPTLLDPKDLGKGRRDEYEASVRGVDKAEARATRAEGKYRKATRSLIGDRDKAQADMVAASKRATKLRAEYKALLKAHRTNFSNVKHK